MKQEFQAGKYTVGIHEDGLRGWFEHNELGDERAGGLWFQAETGHYAISEQDGETLYWNEENQAWMSGLEHATVIFSCHPPFPSQTGIIPVKDRLLALTDYDGLSQLPQIIIDMLRAKGFIVGAEFDSDGRQKRIEEGQTRLFSCFWGNGGYEETVSLEDLGSFRSDNGYDDDDLNKILTLKVGEVYMNHDHGMNSHVVTRVR